jgi:F0F1-type ATP synthase delta subunit
MTEITAKTYADFVLPSSMVTKVDVSRMVTEAEQIDNKLTEAAVRVKSGAAQPTMPVLSEVLEEFLAQNKLSLDNAQERAELIKQLRSLKEKVPIIHMTFAVSADRESLQQIASWLRQSIHPQAVIAVGLQPALIAGVYLRTPNHVHDLSMRAALSGGHDVLVKELETLSGRS